MGSSGSDLRAVDQLIRKLRRKIEPGEDPIHLVTVHGRGYRLALPARDEQPDRSLPEERDRFFGRREETEHIASALSPGALVTLSGPAGKRATATVAVT